MHSEAGFWCGSLKGLLWLCRGIYCERSRQPSLLKRVMAVATPPSPTPWHCSLLGYRISTDFGRTFPLFLLHTLASLQLGNNRHTLLPSCPLNHVNSETVEILPVCICLCPSSPTTSQSFVMHVRWSVYSLHLHCVLGMWHWSNFSLRVLADTVRHRPVNSSNAV